MELYFTLGKLYVEAYGKWFEVVAMFTDIDDSNRYMETHNDTGVLISKGDVIVIANNYDLGKIEV